MIELDIRDNRASEIDTIRFATNDVVSCAGCEGEGIIYVATDDAVCDGIGNKNVAYIYMEDIPNLIKALQKAQELWSASE